MPMVRDLLERFRPVGTPGAAAPAGVPVDRTADRSRELQPVFDRLADVEAECARLHDTSVAEAARHRDRAADEAAAVVATARRDAAAHRADASARLRRGAADEIAATIAAGEHDAAGLTARAEQRMDGYVRRVVAAVRRSTAAAPVEGRAR